MSARCCGGGGGGDAAAMPSAVRGVTPGGLAAAVLCPRFVEIALFSKHI